MRTRTVLLVAASCTGVAATAWAQIAPLDYPQWRGQHRDGAASGFTEPTSWPETLTRRWSVEIGEGYGTPLVIGSTVYLCLLTARR